MYTLMWYRLRANGIIFLFRNSNRITVKCLKHTDPHTLMQHTTSSTAFVLFRYHLFFLPLHFFNPLAHQELRIVQQICGLIWINREEVDHQQGKQLEEWRLELLPRKSSNCLGPRYVLFAPRLHTHKHTKKILIFIFVKKVYF